MKWIRSILSRDIDTNKIPPKPEVTYCDKCGENNSLMLVDKGDEIYVWEVYCRNLRCVK